MCSGTRFRGRRTASGREGRLDQLLVLAKLVEKSRNLEYNSESVWENSFIGRRVTVAVPEFGGLRAEPGTPAPQSQ